MLGGRSAIGKPHRHLSDRDEEVQLVSMAAGPIQQQLGQASGAHQQQASPQSVSRPDWQAPYRRLDEGGEETTTQKRKKRGRQPDADKAARLMEGKAVIWV